MSRIGRLAADLFRVNRRFLRDPQFRRVARGGRPPGEGGAGPQGGPVRPAYRPTPRVPDAAAPYAGMGPFSTALVGVRPGNAPRSVNLMIPDVAEGGVFAGVRTALQAGLALARRLDLPLRVVCFDRTGDPRPRDYVASYVDDELGGHQPGVTVLGSGLLPHTVTNADDLWVATYWTTAHAADVARRAGLLDPDRVVYLVQDYEAGFNEWSSNFALCRATYHAGFHLLVNSTPLDDYLADHEGVRAGEGAVFAPALELDRLAEVAAARAAAARTGDDPVRVFLYGRPTKPRNLFPIGLAALRVATRRLAAEGVAVDAVSAGEPHPDAPLPGGPLAPDQVLRSLGTLSLPGYFDLLPRVDVGLSLQHSPHPSHPPLELAVSGALAVTNEFGGGRAGLHPRLTAVEADADALAEAVVVAVRRARDEGPGAFEPLAPGRLGGTLDDAVAAVAARLPR